MLYEIFMRATELLKEIPSISGSKFTVGADVPENIQDFEGFVAFMDNPSHTQDHVGPITFDNMVTFPGLLVGPQALTGLPWKNRVLMMQYADAIGQKFIERCPLLTNSAGQNLPYVEHAQFVGGRMFTGPYPQGQQQLIRIQYAWTLEVKYTRYRTESS